MKVLFLGKGNDERCRAAFDFTAERSREIDHALGDWGEPFPGRFRDWRGDLIVSYLSRWIVPQELLERARTAAINFHPAPPEYPGIGCVNFAIYNGETSYGATCHHMVKTVDAGGVIAVRRFPIRADDSIGTILEKTYDEQLSLFREVMGNLLSGGEVPASPEQWARPAYTRKEFNDLFVITPDMSRDEVARRVRATSFGRWQPYLDLHGFRFALASGGGRAGA